MSSTVLALSDRPSEEERARALCELAAQTHAALAELARMAVEFDDSEGWSGSGIRSCAHWLAINAGFAQHTGEELLRVGRALSSLPAISHAFAAGELSLDKVREITRVATAADEDVWLELARAASGAQLVRICREVRRAMQADDPDLHVATRGLWWHWDDDGTLRLRAVLPPEEGALVLAAVDAVREQMRKHTAAERYPTVTQGPAATAAPDPAWDPIAALGADALVAICSNTGAAGGEEGPATSLHRVVVHVDAEVLAGAQADGRCHLEGGPPLSAATVRRLGCDAEVVSIVERDGLPIDVGRARRIVPTPLRRALRERDRGCRYPGCPVPVRWTHAHHIEFWTDAGRTELANLVCLCSFHHRRLHDGVYRIRKTDDGDLIFEKPNGEPIQPVPSPIVIVGHPGAALRQQLPTAAHIDAETPRAGDGGSPYDPHHVVWAIAHACEYRRARAGPTN